MRWIASLVVATAMHGVVLGIVARVDRGSTTSGAAPSRIPIDLELVSAKPDPMVAGLASPDTPSARPRPVASVARHRPMPSVPRQRKRGLAPATDTADPAWLRPAAAPAVATPISAPPAPTGAGGVPRPWASSPAVNGSPDVSTGIAVSATPRYRSNPPPEYPLGSRRRREEGVVWLSVVVEPDGAPASVSLARSSGHPLLDRAALDAVRRWTFDPARAAGTPVRSVVAIPVRFSLGEGPG